MASDHVPGDLVQMVWEDKLDEVTTLLGNGLDINAKNNHGDNPLDIATNKGNVDMMALLLEKGADTNLPDQDGWYTLHTAARHGNTNIIKLLLRYGAKVNIETPNKTTPLCTAIRYGPPDMVALFLEAGAEVNIKSMNDWTPLHLALRYSNAEVVQMLISHGATISELTEEGWSVIHLAAQYNTLETVKYLVDNGADVTLKGQNNATALHLAALDATVDMVDLLLSLGAEINAQDENNYNALMHAVFQANTSKVQLLLKHKCQVHLQNNQGWTVLHIAATYANAEITKLLLDAGATRIVDVVDQKGNTALHHAIESGTVDIMQLLLEHASDDINNKGELGWSLLHHAACYGNTEKAEILIQNGADLNPRPIDKSSTPLHVAAIYGSLSMIKLMLENKSDVNAVDLEGISPIHSATRFGCAESVFYMLEYGANINAITEKNCTPLHLAVGNGDMEMVKMMFEKGIENVNARTNEGKTILHIAIEECTALMVNLVIAIGAEVDIPDNNGVYPIHLALLHGTNDVIDLLLDQPSINVHRTNNEGMNPIKLSILGNNIGNLKRMLLFQDSDENIKDALDFAFENNCSTEILNEIDQAYLAKTEKKLWNTDALVKLYRHVTTLIDTSNSMQDVDKFGQTLLHHAARLGIKSHVTTFIENGANLQKKDKNGVTPLHLMTSHPDLLSDIAENMNVELPPQNDEEFHKYACWFHMLPENNPEAGEILPIEHTEAWSAEGISELHISHRIAYWLSTNEMNSKECQDEFQTAQDSILAFVDLLTTQMSDINPDFKLTTQLIGSASEGTKCSYPDQFDYICNLEVFSKMFGLSKDVQSGLDLKCLDMENMAEFSTKDGKLDVMKMKQTFNSILSMALNSEQLKLKMPHNLYVFNQNQKSTRAPQVTLFWNGNIFKWLEIKVSLQPAIQIDFQSQKMRSLPVTSINTEKYMYVVPKYPTANDTDTGNLQISWAAAETRVFQVMQEDIRLGYILAKTLLNPKICPSIDIHVLDTPTKAKEYIHTYFLKTCLMYELVEAKLEGEPIEKDGTEGEEYATNAERVLIWSDRIYARLELFLEQGFLPSYYMPELDILSDQVVKQDNEMASKLRNDNKISQRRNIMYAYCDLIRNKIIHA